MDAIRKVLGDVALPNETGTPVERSGGSNFADELGKAIGAVEETQLEADREAGKVALGGGNLHETAIALQKADIAMRLATKVRNKLVDAYQEVMRMTV
ncbi:MAG TPA: flagellar hook-basal body complex protein FliE [Anaeromyxobacteraceae bacterium]|nr:flagellar hook-basal body complex protein FliE [Anaeromyxobacteraceae bacterium]